MESAGATDRPEYLEQECSDYGHRQADVRRPSVPPDRVPGVV